MPAAYFNIVSLPAIELERVQLAINKNKADKRMKQLSIAGNKARQSVNLQDQPIELNTPMNEVVSRIHSNKVSADLMI